MPRLDRYVAAWAGINRREVRLLLAQGRISVDGILATDIAQVVTRFSKIALDGEFAEADTARYLMMNKPKGVVCATRDAQHTTIVDLLTQPYKEALHIAGRLDFNSTGMVLLSNDGQWSRKLSLPENHLLKRYRVTVEKPLSQAYIAAFKEGMYFNYEGLTTRPASLILRGEREAEVGLMEGRYHQIKRMFGQFDNRVLSIHRFAVGNLDLGQLPVGLSREINDRELASILSHQETSSL